jgi:hypothetical protein
VPSLLEPVRVASKRIGAKERAAATNPLASADMSVSSSAPEATTLTTSTAWTPAHVK